MCCFLLLGVEFSWYLSGFIRNIMFIFLRKPSLHVYRKNERWFFFCYWIEIIFDYRRH